MFEARAASCRVWSGDNRNQSEQRPYCGVWSNQSFPKWPASFCPSNWCTMSQSDLTWEMSHFPFVLCTGFARFPWASLNTACNLHIYYCLEYLSNQFEEKLALKSLCFVQHGWILDLWRRLYWPSIPWFSTRSFRWLINPNTPIPPHASKVHKIRDEDVIQYDTFSQKAKGILEIFHDSDMLVILAQILHSAIITSSTEI